jgi:hypothetical protein
MFGWRFYRALTRVVPHYTVASHDHRSVFRMLFRKRMDRRGLRRMIRGDGLSWHAIRTACEVALRHSKDLNSVLTHGQQDSRFDTITGNTDTDADRAKMRGITRSDAM